MNSKGAPLLSRRTALYAALAVPAPRATPCGAPLNNPHQETLCQRPAGSVPVQEGQQPPKRSKPISATFDRLMHVQGVGRGPLGPAANIVAKRPQITDSSAG